MHNFVKLAALSACVCAFVGCSGGVRVESVDESYSSDGVIVDAKIPQLRGLSDSALEAEINSRIEDSVEDVLEDFEEAARETGDVSELCVKTEEHYNGNGFFSATCGTEATVRGKTRMSRRIAVNIDTRICRELALSDLFEDDGYIDVINARLEETAEANRERYAGLWAKPRLMDGQGFYVSGDELVLYYPPYELSYYERGFVEFPLSLSELRGYLKPEYRRLCPENDVS